MAGFDVGNVTYSDRSLGLDDRFRLDEAENTAVDRFIEFIRSYTPAGNNMFVYRDQLRRHYRLGELWLEIEQEDLAAFDEELAHLVLLRPGKFLPKLEEAASRAIQLSEAPTDRSDENPDVKLPQIQVLLKSAAPPMSIRALMSSHISQIIKVHGIIISASRVHPKASQLSIRCRNCYDTRTIDCHLGMGGPQLPARCDRGRNEVTYRKCPPNPFIVVPDECNFVDSQVLKLQESPETIPTGEMPRNILVSVDRSLCSRVVPGTRVVLTGVYSTTKSSKQTRSSSVCHPYLRVVGLSTDQAATGDSRNPLFKPEEEAEFLNLARTPGLYDLLVRSTAPAIYGHIDIKKAILCQLFGGSAKLLPDRMKLRGDINILLLGDPGTAKSQMLKFVEKVAPIGVYTSGKGSSAAGLTASVVRDASSREFYLEGGAMVLADGGVVCIDEFDKMNPVDRVAIHEAMEQQTISIAKAGITTVLNARTAVLAAANPVFGRYDDMRSSSENIDFQSTILSRFDMVFIIKDRRNAGRDRTIAEHVMRIHAEDHTQDLGLNDSEESSHLSVAKLKRFLAYCRLKCAPRICESAARRLQDYFVNIRASTRSRGSQGNITIPVTIRQLEAIVRISEAVAKMTLQSVASEQHVAEAMRLFNVSTIDALNSGAVTSSEQVNAVMMAEVHNAENLIKQALPVGSSASEHRLIQTFMKQGLSNFAVRKALEIMLKRDELEYRRQRKSIYRKR